MNGLIGIKATLTRYQVQVMSQAIPDRAVADLWAKLLTDYPNATHFNVMAAVK